MRGWWSTVDQMMQKSGQCPDNFNPEAGFSRHCRENFRPVSFRRRSSICRGPITAAARKIGVATYQTALPEERLILQRLEQVPNPRE